jgi:hypothetical protein
MLVKRLLLTGALVLGAGYRVGRDVRWYAARRLREPSRPRAHAS